ncbi:MAG: transporter, partial [Muribaculaceae bacterium]|nr:transporter [Muribaculaceae bacterium]
IPTFVPLVHPNPDLNFIRAGLLILSKVFPLLLFPLFTALLIRRFLPTLNLALVKLQDLSFYIWAFSLSLAIAVTTRSIYHSSQTLATMGWLVAVSIMCCAFQFYIGRRIGSHYDETITGGQALGQKNTVLAIWMGYTFFSPITSIAGGFYSIWHNVVNTIQLYRTTHPHK